MLTGIQNLMFLGRKPNLTSLCKIYPLSNMRWIMVNDDCLNLEVSRLLFRTWETANLSEIKKKINVNIDDQALLSD